MKLNLMFCPFCGSVAKLNVSHPKLVTGKKDTLYQVRCSNRRCGIMTMRWYPKSAAVESWNMRAYSRMSSL